MVSCVGRSLADRACGLLLGVEFVRGASLPVCVIGRDSTSGGRAHMREVSANFWCCLYYVRRPACRPFDVVDRHSVWMSPEGHSCPLLSKSKPGTAGRALRCLLLRPDAGAAQTQRSPVEFRRCPAMVRLPTRGRAQTPDLCRRNQSSEEGRFVRPPIGSRIGRTSSSVTDGG